MDRTKLQQLHDRLEAASVTPFATRSDIRDLLAALLSEERCERQVRVTVLTKKGEAMFVVQGDPDSGDWPGFARTACMMAGKP